MANAQITPKQIALTEARARAGEANALKAKASLEQAELNLGYTKVVAPVDGVVGNRSAQPARTCRPDRIFSRSCRPTTSG